jgi:hypothetical protein
MAQTFKKGYRFMNNADTCEILQREGYMTLTKVTMTTGVVYYDISKIMVDGDMELFQLSMNGNGLIEGTTGGQKTPRPLEEMQKRFSTLIEELETSRRGKQQSLQNIETRTATMAQRVWEVKAVRDAARSSLAAEVNNGKPLTLVLRSKKTQQLAAEIMAAEMILTVIR